MLKIGPRGSMVELQSSKLKVAGSSPVMVTSIHFGKRWNQSMESSKANISSSNRESAIIVIDVLNRSLQAK